MGMMGVFKWLRKDIVQRDRNRRNLTPKINGLNNEAYRNALQAFIDRRRISNDSTGIVSPNSPDKERLEFYIKKNYENEKNKRKDNRECEGIPGVPRVEPREIFEIGWVAGTEDRHIELIYAEWQTTRISLRRHTHPDCNNAIKADLEVLTAIRHPNVLLLMATTHTDDHGLVGIFEPVDCTLFNYVHEQGERVSVQGIAKCAGSLADALKHANMRGYVHGAISSHCVYLATSGVVKLGGWELATSVSNPRVTSEYEERLKFEIYRWLAPEIFKGQQPTDATDVYGLTLLMWEMCTMNVPWLGLTKTEVEKQYVQWGRGVITDLYNFPPLLNNLLDAGLQLDVSKRTLDMSRMRRFLQRLQIQYEDAEPIYIELSSNNNGNHDNNNGRKPVSICTTPDACTPSTRRSASATTTPKRNAEKKSTTGEKEKSKPRSLNLNLVEEVKTKESGKAFRLKPAAAPIENLDRILKGNNVERIDAKNVHNSDTSDKFIPKSRKSRCGDNVAGLAGLAIDTTDDESFADPRGNIKKLKEDLASKRENFFYGSDSSQYSDVEKIENPKSRMLNQVRSKDYEPHKPASHKTHMEPKQIKSPGDYNSIPDKSACTYFPTSVRESVFKSKLSNSDSSNFFETSLWKKEKMICISKMRKNDVNGSTYSISRFPSAANNTDKANSTETNRTYTVETDRVDDSTVSVERTIADSTMTRGKSLQALSDALERATEIVRSTTPHPSESSTDVSSSFKTQRNSNVNPVVTGTNESLFENLYEINRDEPDTEIMSIERLANGEKNFFIPLDDKSGNSERVDPDKNDTVVRRRKTLRDEKRGAFEGSRLSSVACESIAESLNENETLSGESKPDDGTVILSESGLSPEPAERRAIFDFQCHTDIDASQSRVKQNDDDPPQDSETSFALMIFNDKTSGRCDSCYPKSNLARRRSLPAGLGQLRNLNNASLGKLPIRKVEIPDNTVEDLYIDDEFGDSLNVNMVLLDEDVSLDDEDFLPDLLEQPDSRVGQ